MNKQEKLAWIRLAAASLAVAYLCWTLSVHPHTSAKFESGDWLSIACACVIVLFAVAYSVVAWSQGIDEDERDIRIKASALQAGYVTFFFLLMFIAQAAGMDADGSFLASRSGGWVKLFLFACMGIGVIVESVVRVCCYWRDRP